MRADLRAADAALQEAVDALRRAHALGWESKAGDAFRAYLGDLAGRVRANATALDAVRLATARLAAHS